MMQINFYHLCELAIVCISVSFFSCEGKISAEPVRARRQQEETGVCFNVPDCEFTGGVSTDSLVTFDDCCNKIGGKSRALHNGACRNCIRNGSGELLILVRYANKTHFCCFEPELSPTVAEPSPNGNSDSISDWTPWGACSHTCGPSGTRSRQNICGPSNKLTVCKEQDQKCNRDVSCPVNGQWGRWSRWSSCSKKCKRSRKRSCDRPKPSDGGNDCVGVAREKTRCKRNPPCQVHGGWSAWTQQPCTRSCGGGFQIVTRQCDNPTPENGGRDCVGSELKYRPCTTKCCPVHGHWSEYTSWSLCEVTCGGGRRFRKRKCDNPPPSCNGRNCSGFSIDTEACSPNDCPVDGGWSAWTTTVCTKRCEAGHQEKFRKCDNPKPSGRGADCPGIERETVPCNEQPCPVDGEWSFWSSWSTSCPKCGIGSYKNRTRMCDDPPPQNGGLFCPGPISERTPCSISNCPVNGGWSSWTDFTDCPKSCGGSRYQRTRKCDKPPPNFDGLPCSGEYRESKPCNTQKCPVNGGWSYWTEWSHCSTTCNRGGRNRLRACNNPKPRYNGTECPGPATEWAACPGPRSCPVDGGWSPWSQFSPCTASCEGGTNESYRECNSPRPHNNGRYCGGFARRTFECNKHPCPVDGGWTWWSSWSSCSSTCKGGTQSRTRQCTNPPPRFQGVSCQGLNVETQTCAKIKCPVDGNWGKWSVWSECSKICETGTRFRTRLCNNPRPEFGGKQCNDPSTGREESLCNTHKCPVNGGWGAWTEYTFCSKTCDTGSQKRSRKCNNPPPKYEGTGCNGNDAESRLCNKFGCPVDSSYSQWTSWAECSRSCGRGNTERTRHCNLPLNGGRPCLSIGLPQESKVCCKRSCIGTVSYTTYSLVSSQTAIVQRYTVACGIWDLGRCERSRTVYKRKYVRQEKTLYRHATKDSC
ncbi:A disintegrin and metalloproteinase with thrombospondin motifs adt-1-like isoform X2 [Corticium candelabrum]|uniref:A disintegrin and metalloproteinase with thrombospondin motifs adt-1-like isoform X2 n=1 Tax=Corticium candelabrum TaxID=121492 RepID=UPI002E26FA4E|nr:A disintegrin and metalloproteinase with thrombospondin motifs adt-1-like isoform X2 [Corticium candelabrum]